MTSVHVWPPSVVRTTTGPVAAVTLAAPTAHTTVLLTAFTLDKRCDVALAWVSQSGAEANR